MAEPASGQLAELRRRATGHEEVPPRCGRSEDPLDVGQRLDLGYRPSIVAERSAGLVVEGSLEKQRGPRRRRRRPCARTRGSQSPYGTPAIWTESPGVEGGCDLLPCSAACRTVSVTASAWAGANSASGVSSMRFPTIAEDAGHRRSPDRQTVDPLGAGANDGRDLGMVALHPRRPRELTLRGSRSSRTSPGDGLHRRSAERPPRPPAPTSCWSIPETPYVAQSAALAIDRFIPCSCGVA